MRTLFAGEERCGRALREDDRGAAGLRSDMPHRGRGGRARVDQTGWVSEMASGHRRLSHLAIANAITGRAVRSALPWPGLVPIGRSLRGTHRSRPGSCRRPCRLTDGRPSMMGRRASTLSFQAGRSGLHRPSISLRLAGLTQGTTAASCIWRVRRGLDAGIAPPQGGALPGILSGCGQAGHLFPPAISRGRYQPSSPPRVLPCRGPSGSRQRDVQRARREPQGRRASGKSA